MCATFVRKKRRRIDPQKIYTTITQPKSFHSIWWNAIIFFKTTLNSPTFSVNLKVHRWMHAHNEC